MVLCTLFCTALSALIPAIRLPMLVRWGLLTAAVAALGTGILVRGTVYPLSRETAAREAYSLLGSAAAQTLQSLELTDSALPQRLGDSLEQDAGALRRLWQSYWVSGRSRAYMQ